ncbi:MAG: hypothetical protein COX07_08805 [Bacteroidetes bacterium CG23_combo_of_CG06-09_8_20_14_all_32_9]|nr:MAG: hypothetical protein COX07_08805 [Bacteroidetes bacterium CG23_combo_of_CG06-09_8_20_14_all_32_9]
MSLSGITSLNNNEGQITLTVTGGELPYTYNWSYNDNPNFATTQNLSGLGAGTFIVTVTDNNTCAITDTFTIDIPFKIPTVITPNGDGKNDDFEITNIQSYKSVQIEIFNRWGDRLFVFDGTGYQYKDPSNRWNGKYNGKDLPMGGYMYIIKISGLEPINGIVSIIR